MCLVQLAWPDIQAPLAIDFEDQATAKMYRRMHISSFDGKRIPVGPSRELTGTCLFRHNAMFPIITPEGYPGQSFAPGWDRQGSKLYPSLSGDDQTSSTQHECIFGVLAWRRCADITSGTGMGGRLPGATVEVHPDSHTLDKAHPQSPPASSLLMEQDAGGESSDPGDE